MQYSMISIKTLSAKETDAGSLSVFEACRDIPFEIKRVYYIHGVAAGERRGYHAHKALKQMMFCPYGSIRIGLDDGQETAEIVLDDPSKGLVLEPGLWRTMDWLVDNSVLCVMASDYYTESDYIRNYSDFLEYRKTMGERC